MLVLGFRVWLAAAHSVSSSRMVSVRCIIPSTGIVFLIATYYSPLCTTTWQPSTHPFSFRFLCLPTPISRHRYVMQLKWKVEQGTQLNFSVLRTSFFAQNYHLLHLTSFMFRRISASKLSCPVLKFKVQGL